MKLTATMSATYTDTLFSISRDKHCLANSKLRINTASKVASMRANNSDTDCFLAPIAVSLLTAGAPPTGPIYLLVNILSGGVR